MSRHPTPASARARRMAIAPMSIPVRSAKRPNGCSPTPTVATSTASPPLQRSNEGARAAGGPECERHDLVAIVVGTERHQHELHFHARPQACRLGETRLDPDSVGELHVADPVRYEGIPGWPGVRGR